MTYQVNVTWEDKIDGEAAKPTKCAIAQAIMRAYPEAIRVSVDSNDIAFTEGNVRRWYHTPVEAAEWLIAFDGKTDTEEVSAMPDISFELIHPYRSKDVEHHNSKPTKKTAPSNNINVATPQRRWTRDGQGRSVLVEM